MRTAGSRRRLSGWFENHRSPTQGTLPVGQLRRANVEALEGRVLLSLVAPVSGPVAETATDLALGRPAFASSRYDDLALYDASRVTDANPLTRWASQRSRGRARGSTSTSATRSRSAG